MLPLGGYYQWFHKLNYIRYGVNFCIFYIKSSLVSNCYYKITIVVIILYLILVRYLYSLNIILYRYPSIHIDKDDYLYYVFSLFSYLEVKKYIFRK